MSGTRTHIALGFLFEKLMIPLFFHIMKWITTNTVFGQLLCGQCLTLTKCVTANMYSALILNPYPKPNPKHTNLIATLI